MNKLAVPDFDRLNLPDSIEEFFTKEEYANICPYERKRLQNMRRNYEMMIYVGLPAIKPDFMQPNRSRRRKRAEEEAFSTNSDNDDEWLPSSKRRAGRTAWRPPFQTASKPAQTKSQKDQKFVQAKTQDKRKRKPKKKDEVRVYTFRKRKETNYMKLEVPDDDEFLYCEECNQEHSGDCPVHGALLLVDDIPVSMDIMPPHLYIS
ncbi:hypothetical protein BaRGS_00031691 [Batillaria attramentaria]|uniref:KRAB-related domain-containing protein n=1 Tax=Batillaria attramentaria TaxID=370345 RepID=A0ABD0JQ53_9CAEN